jgi:L-iditol 2-dehydrogenase
MIACQVARLKGAAPVILAAPSGPRMDKASELKLADVFLAVDESLEARLRSVVGRHGVDVAMDCAGVPEATTHALNLVRAGGRVVLYGVHVKPIAEFDVNKIVLRDLVIFGTLSDRVGWREVIELVGSGKLKLDPLITHSFTLENAPGAYEAVRKRTSGLVKAVIKLGFDR